LTAGLLRTTSGTIFVGGMDATRRNSKLSRLIGYVPQIAGSHPHISVAELLDFIARAYRLRKRERQQRITDVLMMVDALDHANQPVESLPSSLRKRIEIARAMIHDPQVLLLDDPIGGMYDATRLSMCGLIKQLADKGKAVLVTGRSFSRLIDIADTAAVLVDGRLRAFGQASHVMNQFAINRTYEVRLTRGSSISTAVRVIGEQLGKDTSVFGSESDDMVRFTTPCDDSRLAQVTEALIAAHQGVIRVCEIEQEMQSQTIAWSGVKEPPVPENMNDDAPKAETSV